MKTYHITLKYKSTVDANLWYITRIEHAETEILAVGQAVERTHCPTKLPYHSYKLRKVTEYTYAACA